MDNVNNGGDLSLLLIQWCAHVAHCRMANKHRKPTALYNRFMHGRSWIQTTHRAACIVGPSLCGQYIRTRGAVKGGFSWKQVRTTSDKQQPPPPPPIPQQQQQFYNINETLLAVSNNGAYSIMYQIRWSTIIILYFNYIILKPLRVPGFTIAPTCWGQPTRNWRGNIIGFGKPTRKVEG